MNFSSLARFATDSSSTADMLGVPGCEHVEIKMNGKCFKKDKRMTERKKSPGGAN